MKTMSKKQYRKAMQLSYIADKINELPQSFWGDASSDDYYKVIGMLHPSNVKDWFYPSYGTPERELMNEFSDKYDLFDFILNNRKAIEFSERYGTGVDYDCSGKCIGNSLSIHKMGDSMILIKSASFDI